MFALDWLIEPDDRPQQNRFPAAGPSDNAEDFAAEYIEIESVMYGFASKTVYQAAHADDRLTIAHGQIFKVEKTTEKMASVTITRKIASTTDNVVNRPTLSALPDTCRPS